MVISSSGGAARGVGHALGQYEYLEDKGYYVQTSTEQRNEMFVAIYLYPVEDDKFDKWLVWKTHGEKAGWLYNPRSSQTLPSSGWTYSDGTGTWPSDQTLTVTPGPLPPLPRQFIVTATGAAAEVCPKCLGVFTKTQRWWLGRPVYVNTGGWLLHHGPEDYGWLIGDKLLYGGLRGSRGRHSPAEEDNWKYASYGEWKPASVTVTGSD